MRTRTYERLIAWKEVDELCILVYRDTKKFPQEEKSGLVSQMRRAACSIPMNIAEGNAERSAKGKAHFSEIAISSWEELHYQAKLSLRYGYLSEENLQNIDDCIQRTGYLLTKLRASIT